MIEYFSYTTKNIELNSIAELFGISFNQNFNKEYWEWRFLKNPNSKNIYINYAEEKGKLIAYYAVSPLKLIDKDGGIVNVALSNMTMTHPNYQGKGLFNFLANNTFQQLKNDKFIGVLGFANSNSHYGFRKNLGWLDISILNIFKLRPCDFRKNIFKNDLDCDFSLNPIDNIDLSFIDSMYRIDNKIMTLLDKQNFKWRFIDIPNRKYQSVQL